MQKIRRVLQTGLQATVTTQFSDAWQLVRWLHGTRHELSRLAAEVDMPGKVSFHIGVPGPTPQKRLERIAAICEVPTTFITPQHVLLERLLRRDSTPLDGAREGLQRLARRLQLRSAEAAATPLEVVKAVVDDATAAAEAERADANEAFGSSSSSTDFSKAGAASGPSAFVAGDSGGTKGALWPEETILALATYCEKEGWADDELSVHVFPFGGLTSTGDLVSALRRGAWPVLT
eukprot:TRINITY_DN67338_c0_g1_i1.p1 TRINITY_DN67338_c0_g1~~TRINITY_DN67338_c0_g1_i1.p1  ORF type:complete len:234 (+),score=56.24 TRINITY_DN67338_c0_g1_i1:695-1396(+)